MTGMEDQQLQEKLELRDLVVRAQAEDRAAFGLLAQRFERAVYLTALRRLNNDAEAQELTQEVLIQAMRKLPQLREPDCFPSWLKSMTVRMAINRAVRRGNVVSAEPETLDAACVDARTPLANALAEERAHQVRSGLQRLRALDRDTLEAFYVRGRTLIEMSDEFDSPVGTIKRRLHVARKRLAKELEQLAL